MKTMPLRMKSYAQELKRSLPNLLQLSQVTVAVMDDDLTLVIRIHDGPIGGEDTELIGMCGVVSKDVEKATEMADRLVDELRQLGIKAHRHRWDGEETFEQAVTRCQKDLEDLGEAAYNDHLIRPVSDQQYTVTGFDRFNTVRGAMRAINKYLQ